MLTLREKWHNASLDIGKAFSEKTSVWLALGSNDVKNRYNRSRLGVLWACVSIMVFVLAVAPIYSELSDVDFVPYVFHLLIGLIVWSLVSAIVTECCREFIGSQEILESFSTGYFTLIMRVIWRNLIVLGYHLLVFVGFAVIFQLPISAYWLFVPLAFILITLNAAWVGLLLSMLATRYRDIPELLNNIVRLLYFVTPILWMPEQREELEKIAQYNPLQSMIQLVREPLTQGSISHHDWLLALLVAAVGWLITLIIFSQYRHKISYWL